MGEISDNEIVQLVKNGERSAFSLLVRRHQKGLLRISQRFLKDINLSEDVVQESFIKAFEKLHTFEARSSFKSWLIQIAINTAKNKIRDRREESTDMETIPIAVLAVAETSLVHGSIARHIQRHIDELPQKQKMALTLRIYEDLSFKEIAEIMECPYDTAKANYRHALLRLREELKNQTDLRLWTGDIGGLNQEGEWMVKEVES
jgi:RNA polymerase sigma-70 factor (ECF subfamily)